MLPALLPLRFFWLALISLTACSSPAPEHRATTTAASPAAQASPLGQRDSTTILARADRGRIQGDSTAKVWLVIVSDFQCPFCRQWHDEVFATVVRDYVNTGKIRLAYVNLPLSGHMNAVPAAQAAMCTSAQGKFWAMHDALFRTQDRWAAMSDPSATFDSLAASVGVDSVAFQSCVRSKATLPMIDADRQRAEDAGVRATPTFFIGDQRIEGAVPLQEFRAALDKALAGR